LYSCGTLGPYENGHYSLGQRCEATRLQVMLNKKDSEIRKLVKEIKKLREKLSKYEKE